VATASPTRTTGSLPWWPKPPSREQMRTSPWFIEECERKRTVIGPQRGTGRPLILLSERREHREATTSATNDDPDTCAGVITPITWKVSPW